MKTIFDHLRECAGNGDMPTLDAEDAQRIVETYDELLAALQKLVEHTLDCEKRLDEFHGLESDAGSGCSVVICEAQTAINRAIESRPLQIGRG